MSSSTVDMDPELESLPEPRRPWRRLTLGLMALTALASVLVAASLWPAARYALWSEPPRELGHIGSEPWTPASNNAWVHVRGTLEAAALEYRRPLEPDTFRLARAENDPSVWVEVRIPTDLDPTHYVAPTSFVGRLTRLDTAGLRHTGVADEIARLQGEAPGETWLLVDGETPSALRWVLGAVALLVGFAVWSVWGLVHLARPVRDT